MFVFYFSWVWLCVCVFAIFFYLTLFYFVWADFTGGEVVHNFSTTSLCLLSRKGQACWFYLFFFLFVVEQFSDLDERVRYVFVTFLILVQVFLQLAWVCMWQKCNILALHWKEYVRVCEMFLPCEKIKKIVSECVCWFASLFLFF